MPDFSEFLQVPTDVKESINLTDGGSIKLLISEMSNMGFKSESTGSNYKKSEQMCNSCIDSTRDFTKLNNMEKHYIKCASGTQLSISLTVFSTWMLIESNPGLDDKEI